MNDLGQQLRRRREALGLSLLDVSTRAPFDLPKLRLVEGGRRNVRSDSLARLAAALDCDVRLVPRDGAA